MFHRSVPACRFSATIGLTCASASAGPAASAVQAAAIALPIARLLPLGTRPTLRLATREIKVFGVFWLGTFTVSRALVRVATSDRKESAMRRSRVLLVWLGALAVLATAAQTGVV